MNIFYYDIAIGLPLRQCFTYKSNVELKKGIRVLVPFGNKKLVGIVVKKNINSHLIEKSESIKDVISIIDNHTCFNSSIFNTILWASEYYHHPIGEVFFSFIPPILRKVNDKTISALGETSKYKINEQDKIFKLTDEQKSILLKLSKIRKFKPSLIYGVTGSGKTEIYLQLAEKFLLENKSILVLVPEINLIPQLAKRFQNRFDGDIGIYHSKQTPNQRLKVWLKSKFGDIKVVIGTRSSVLMPLQNLGAIIVDEEHDQSYKQSKGFKFSGRDLSIKRAQLENVPIFLGSATPSLQTLKLVKEKKYERYDLLRRVDGNKPPKLISLDITDTPLTGGIADESMEIIESVLNRGEQVLVFINRRGFAPLYECDNCGWVAKCNSCDSKLVYHKSKNRLICHKCESAFQVNKHCPECNSDNLNIFGNGTERVEEVLKNTFKKTPIIRVDYDSTRLKGSIEAIYDKVNKSNEAILVGTQMLSKGHDFSKVTLCIILNADGGLISPEINSVEKISQQLIQVSGRAGRNNNLAKVIIQTRYPEDVNLKKIKTGDYKLIAEECLRVNKKLDMPPYSSLCILRAVSPNSKSSFDFLRRASKFLDNKKDISTTGPLPSIPFKINGNTRNHLIIKSSAKVYLNKILKNLTKEIESWPERKKVKWSFDIDPYEMT
ncbi:MAG: primosomal protein N' [SAR86 cluster bacterium]|jgi:primosomal protein N' (replication factor Y)|nr:MAG: primosomal protein N' [SAR86 cluster bacterium]URQ69655.1 primosomal protein N' [SAR86 cluster bacterium]|tara:strand:+ start:512 stop:2500 length:1989 start_codon:yes stop_codon:yes gene_type:complete